MEICAICFKNSQINNLPILQNSEYASSLSREKLLFLSWVRKWKCTLLKDKDVITLPTWSARKAYLTWSFGWLALASHLPFKQLLTHCSHRPLDNLYSSCPSLIIPEKDIHKKRPNSFATYVKASSGTRFSNYLLLKRNLSSFSRHVVRPDPRADRQQAPGELSPFHFYNCSSDLFPFIHKKGMHKGMHSLSDSSCPSSSFILFTFVHFLQRLLFHMSFVFPVLVTYFCWFIFSINCVLQSKGESWQDSRIGPVG